MIGLASLVLLTVNGRIAGISGILSASVCRLPDSGNVWRLFFLVGLLAGGAVYQILSTSGVNPELQVSAPLMAVSGLLVGFGTRLGSGCTSGHGVCGIGRLSPRSLAATLTFMLSAIFTVYLVRHVFQNGVL